MWETETPSTPPQDTFIPRPFSPFKSYISGVGIVEASSDNIFITTPVNRIIDKVFVTVGTEVKKGDILFSLEARDLKAELMTQQIAYEIALAKLKKLEVMPRREDIEAVEADLKSAQIELDQAKNHYEMTQALRDKRALSQQEINQRLFNYQQMEAKWQQAKAHLDKIKAGTWQPDIKIASLEAQQAKAHVEQVEADIERTIIRSPIDGKVLQIKIHEGESPSLGSQTPLMIVGNIDEMYLKVSINQFDAPYFRSNAPAVAFLRGDARVEFPLEFVRLEPFLVNKQNLTHDITEKVDTRVLQVIYLIKNSDQNIFVGQQMDVFIESEYP